MIVNASWLALEPDLFEKISALPDTKFVEAIDMLAPLAERSEVKHFIDEVRPRLRQLRPRRAPTLQRILFQPVGDLLTSDPRPTGAPTVPRSAIGLCWSLIQEREPQQLAKLNAVLAEISPGDARALQALSHRLWDIAASTIAAAEKEGGVPEPVALAGKVLAVAGEVEAFKHQLPQFPLPLQRDDPRPLQKIETAMEAIRLRGCPVDGYILAVAARLESPAQLFSLMQDADIPLPEVAARRLGSYVIDDLIRQAESLERAPAIKPEDAARDADRLFRTLSGAQRNLTGAMKSALDEGTRHVEGVIKEMLGSHVIGPAAEIIGAAIVAPGTAPAVEQLVAAESHARALARSRPLAQQVGLEHRASATVSAIQNRLTASVEAALERDPNQGDKGSARKTVFGTIRLIELLAGPQEAEPLLRRAQKCLATDLAA